MWTLLRATPIRNAARSCGRSKRSSFFSRRKNDFQTICTKSKESNFGRKLTCRARRTARRIASPYSVDQLPGRLFGAAADPAYEAAEFVVHVCHGQGLRPFHSRKNAATPVRNLFT